MNCPGKPSLNGTDGSSRKSNKEKDIRSRVWFGLNAVVIIGPGFIHRAGLGWFLIPHPPLVNWVLRLGLPGKNRRDLGFNHEFGHLRTAPLAVLNTMAMLALELVTGSTSLIQFLLVFIGTHASWEIAAEVITATDDYQYYRQCYQGQSMLPRAIFWGFTIFLTLLGWFVVWQ